MAQLSAPELAALQAAVDASPEIQSVVQAWETRLANRGVFIQRYEREQAQRDLAHAIAASLPSFPDNYNVSLGVRPGESGRVIYHEGWSWKSYVIIGGAVAFPFVVGAIGAAVGGEGAAAGAGTTGTATATGSGGLAATIAKQAIARAPQVAGLFSGAPSVPDTAIPLYAPFTEARPIDALLRDPIVLAALAGAVVLALVLARK